MPRKPRIDIPGFYHIINRGVERRDVFLEQYDYEYFIKTLCESKKHFDVILHNYCLMSNHYHLLIQTQKPNLSKFMRHLNSAYAIYFNKKYNRSGHLWQGRFKSWYVTNKGYLFTLMRYIEQNPMRAKIVESMEAYPYASYRHFMNPKKIPECLRDSWIVQNYQNNTESIKAFLEQPVQQEDLIELKKASQVADVSIPDNETDIKVWEQKLMQAKDKKERNEIVIKAYNKGVSQHKIAQILKISQPRPSVG